MLDVIGLWMVSMAFSSDIDAVKALLAERGQTVAELCRQAGIARSTWERWVSGRTQPNMATWSSVREAAEALPVRPAQGDPREAA